MNKNTFSTCILLATACAFVPAPADCALPADPGKGVVAAAHPLAAEAGVEMLEKGGNAIDAAVAVSLTLCVAEPQSSGLGGGGFMLYYDAGTEEIDAIDFRERSPAAFTTELLSPDGVLSDDNTTYGGLSIGVPGVLLGLLEAHERHGALPLEVIVEPAVRAAGEGYEVYPFLADMMGSSLDKLMEDEASAQLYLVDGVFPYSVGDTFTNPTLAQLINRIPEEGAGVIYAGDGAKAIAAAVQGAGGVMTVEDVESATVHPLGTLSGRYHGYTIIGPASPSAGGAKVVASLELMAAHGALNLEEQSHESIGLICSSLMEATAAADALIGDPALVGDRAADLLRPSWQAAAQLRMANAVATASSVPTMPMEPDTGKTTHFSIADADGNFVSWTQTINYFFGSGVSVPELGFMLNNQLADFTYVAGHPNAPGPSKVPRSNMAPLLVLRDGEGVGSIGSPGGSRIPSALVQIVVHLIDGGTSLQEAIDAPRLHVDPDARRISYEDRIATPAVEDAAARLAAQSGLDWRISKRDALDKYFGGAHAVWAEGGPQGAADPRRAGTFRLVE